MIDARKQWSPRQLSSEICACPYGDNVNVYIKPEALHQGLFLFKKVLRRLAHEIIPMPGKINEMQISSFMELPARSKGLNIIFSWAERPEGTLEDVLENISATANAILSGGGYNKCRFRSLGDLYGYLWLENVREQSVILDTPEITDRTPINEKRKISFYFD